MAISDTQNWKFQIYLAQNTPKTKCFRPEQAPIVVNKRDSSTEINLLLVGNPEEGHFQLLKPTSLRSVNNKDKPETDIEPTECLSELNASQATQTGERINKANPKPTGKSRRHKWTDQDYKEIIWCHYYILESTGTANIKQTYALWQSRNPTLKEGVTPNTLATQRRFILNNNKLSSTELNLIQKEAKKEYQKQSCESGDICIDQSQSIQELVAPGNQPEILNAIERKNDDDDDEQEILNLSDEIYQKVTEDTESNDRKIERKPLKKLNDNERTRALIRKGNKAMRVILQKHSQQFKTLTNINKLVYSTGEIIQNKIIPDVNTKHKTKEKKPSEPPWKRRIEKKILNFRKDLAQLQECQKPNLSRKMQSTKIVLSNKYKIKNVKDHTLVVEKLKQKISAQACRMRRYSKRNEQYHHNKLFAENAAKFYNNVMKKNINVAEVPSSKSIEEYWKSIWEKNVEHNGNAKWLQAEYEKTASIERMEWLDITESELKASVNTSANWKSPGSDGIPNFWLKRLTEIHSALSIAFDEVVKEEVNIPQWLTKGKTYLIPKNKNTGYAKNYRPITCLNNIYKVLTKIMSKRIYMHLSKNNLFAEEQKGCMKNSYGCKDHLLLSQLIHKDCKENRKSLSLAWIDYKKAFDSVPHSWLIEALNIYRVAPSLLAFICKTMAMWKTDLNLTANENTVTIKNINIKNGIYQGDSLSPLLFCIALFPLSSALNDTQTGYSCKNEKSKVNHLLYVDDLKLIAKNEKELEEQLEVVKQFSDDIHMEFGLEKCAKATFKKGKLKISKNLVLGDSSVIQSLDYHETYKYLGVDEHDGVNHKEMKTKLTREYFRRVREILKTQLNSKYKITAITSLATPVVTYSFGIIKWTKAEIRKLDSKTRKLLTMNGAFHPKSDVDRLYTPRKEGGRGMINIETTYEITLEGLHKYLMLKQNDKFLGMVYRRQNQSANSQDNPQQIMESVENSSSETAKVKSMKNKLKHEKKMERIGRWREKPMHGQILIEAEKETINTNLSWMWLTHANLKAETESLIAACQEQAITTNYVKVKVFKSGSDLNCRLCRQYSETIHHVVSGCPVLAKRAYLERHDAVAKQLHWNICRAYNITVAERWYNHTPDLVIDTSETTIIWDSQVQTDRTIKANKPDIIVKDKKLKTCLLIDVAIPSDYNITQKEAEKRLKYKDLQIETQRMWNLKTKVIPIVIGATGLVSNYTSEIIKEVPGAHNILSMQKAVVLSTARIVRRVIS